MKHITFYLDFISPYAWLAFERLPEALVDLSYSVEYRPVLLGALLQQHANPGPAGIAPKRAWTYRHVPLLRQALTCSDDGCINRYVAGTVLRHVWQDGHDALDPERLAALAADLAEQIRPGQDMHSEGPKALLRANTEAAQAVGVFGVPAFVVDGKVFWGLDGLPMLRAYLEGDDWFAGAEGEARWAAPELLPSGLKQG